MADYAVADLNQAAWLVYINGLEIPAVRIDITIGVWQPSTVNIQLIPHPLLQQIGKEDRLQVAVFYLDTHWIPEHPEFCLLGEFEINGWSYRNSPYGRVITLHGSSQLDILSQLNFFYISSLDDMVTASGKEGANPQNQQVVKTLYPASLFLEGLTEAAKEFASGTSAASELPVDKFIKRPIDFVYNLFRSILSEVDVTSDDPTISEVGSGKLPPTAVSSPGKNFYARWFKMTNFHRRWAALPLLEDEGAEGCFPIVKAAQETQTLQALEQQIGQTVGNAGTAWQLLQKVLGYMLMEIVTIPAPPAAITEKKTGRVKGRTAYIPRDRFTQPSTEVMSIPTYFVKPQCLFSIPPACNVIFPSMVTNFSFKESYMSQPTRVYLGESFVSSVLNTSNNGSMSSLVNEALTTGFPEQVRARQKSLLKSPQSNDKNFLLFPEEFFKGPISTRLSAPPWMYLLSQQSKANEASGFSSPATDSINTVLGVGYDPVAVDSATGLGSLFDKYAEYEYYRTRYASSSGGAQLAWNPYIVPGFPSVVFDQNVSASSVLGYVSSVTHTLQTSKAGSSMSTSVNLTHIRLLTEAIVLSSADTSEGYDIAPPEPIAEIGNAFQRYANVQDVYSRMLFSGREGVKKTYFDSSAVVTVTTNLGGEVDPKIAVVDEIDYLNVKATPAYEEAFNNYTVAMKYASRPVCTLKEYIETFHGRPLEDLIADSTVRGEYRSFYSKTRDKFRSFGAVFWGRIYSLVQGPGQDPGVSVSNMGSPPDYSSAGDGNLTFVDTSTGMPQTRRNWDRRLEEYRKIIRSEKGKVAPLE